MTGNQIATLGYGPGLNQIPTMGYAFPRAAVPPLGTPDVARVSLLTSVERVDLNVE